MTSLPQRLPRIAATLVSLVLAAAATAAPEPVSFAHKDWVVQCDNTGTCRAAGYQDEAADTMPISLLLVRAAGPGTAVEVQLQAYEEDEPKGPFTFTVGRARVTVPSIEPTTLAPVQAAAVLRELPRARAATLSGAGRRWLLSLAGLQAVLLKMDEIQGRLDTPGALARRGTRPEQDVPPARAAPVVRAVAAPAERAADEALRPAILARLDRKAIDEACNDVEIDQAQLTRLDAHRLLVAVPCGTGAYNYTQLLWLAPDRPPHVLTRLDEVAGEFDPKTGSVTQSMKGRGIGDCWSTTEWHFDGNRFVKTRETVDTLCRGFPGGAWNLPLWVSTIVPTPGPHDGK